MSAVAAQFHHIKWTAASYRNKMHKDYHLMFTLDAHIALENGKR